MPKRITMRGIAIERADNSTMTCVIHEQTSAVWPLPIILHSFPRSTQNNPTFYLQPLRDIKYRSFILKSSPCLSLTKVKIQTPLTVRLTTKNNDKNENKDKKDNDDNDDKENKNENENEDDDNESGKNYACCMVRRKTRSQKEKDGHMILFNIGLDDNLTKQRRSDCIRHLKWNFMCYIAQNNFKLVNIILIFTSGPRICSKLWSTSPDVHCTTTAYRQMPRKITL